jgi:hypothetical protein
VKAEEKAGKYTEKYIDDLLAFEVENQAGTLVERELEKKAGLELEEKAGLEL